MQQWRIDILSMNWTTAWLNVVWYLVPKLYCKINQMDRLMMTSHNKDNDIVIRKAYEVEQSKKYHCKKPII